MKISNLHLILSIIIVIPAAIIYGFFPNSLLDITPNTLDEQNFQKAVMGLYISFSLLWILGIFRTAFWKVATASNACFMLGLGFGRLLSLFYDGKPSLLFVIGMVGEFVLGFYALWILKNQKSQ